MVVAFKSIHTTLSGSFATMNFNRISNKVTVQYIADPYTMLINYKRSFKFLKLLKENNAPVLVIGTSLSNYVNVMVEAQVTRTKEGSAGRTILKVFSSRKVAVLVHKLQ